jgi:ketosteroid isomerase-like protein
MAAEGAAQNANAGPRAGAAAAHGPRERAVLDAVDAYHRALIAHDAKALERIYAADYTFINDKGELVARAGRLANLGTGATAVGGIDNVREATVRIYGDNAVVQNRLTLRGQYSGRATDADVRVTYVWLWRAGRWQLVTNQVTPVLP